MSEQARTETLEMVLVASLLASPHLIDANRIAPAMLVNPFAARILAAMQKLRINNQRVTEGALMLASEAPDRDAVRKLREVEVETDVAMLVAHLQRHAAARSIRAAARSVDKLAASGDVKGAREALGRALIAQDAGDVPEPVLTFRELLLKTVSTLTAEGQTTQIALGMEALDGSYKLSAGSMLVLGAQTNVGKTSLVMTWLMSIARRGTPVGIVSVEDPDEDFGAKALGALTGINPSLMWAGKMKTQDWQRCIDLAMPHADLPISYAHVGSRRIDEVLARIEFMARTRGVRVVAVDYLQAISHRAGKDTRERIDNTLEDLISLCGRLGVALVLCSQLARPDKGSPFKEPHLIDLKESGAIENRAQCVVLCWRENDKPHAPVKAKIAKAKRQAAGNRFTLRRDPDTGMLVDETTLSTFGADADAPQHEDDETEYRVGGWPGRAR